MLTLISESAAQVNLPLVTIDPGTIVFTLINTLIIFILFKVFLFKPVGKILDKRNEMAAAEIRRGESARRNPPQRPSRSTSRSSRRLRRRLPTS